MPTTSFKPFRLQPQFHARIWGRSSLRPWYESPPDAVIGEAWLTGPACEGTDGRGTLEARLPGFPLLVKILFPDDKLSVQVHPDDAQARVLGLERGKTECWYLLDAEPGAEVACGLKPGVTVAHAGAAALDGTMEDRMQMLPVVAGDMIFVDAGTVHAVGPGMTLLEVQQTCDVTYRLFDYGRPRELHLEQGLAVVKTETRAGKIAPRVMDGFTRLIETDYFVVDRYERGASIDPQGLGCVVGLGGGLDIADVAFKAGEAVVLPVGRFTVEGDSPFIHAFEPQSA